MARWQLRVKCVGSSDAISPRYLDVQHGHVWPSGNRHQHHLIPAFDFSDDLDVALSPEQVGDDTTYHRLIICQ